MSIFKKLMIIWLLIGFLFWTYYIFYIDFIYQFLYYYFIVFVVGIYIYLNIKQIQKKLQAWSLNDFAKFLILGYATVLFEETFAALFNHLSEGFNLSLFLVRIVQFWALNLFAFTGFYLAWYFLIKKYRFSYTEIFFIAGTWGLFSEKILFSILSNPLYLFFMTPIMLFVYGLMITLPILSIKPNLKSKEINLFKKYLISMLFIFLFSIIPILILQTLRTNYPLAFPPVDFIPI